jgi:hypothetical protein
MKTLVKAARVRSYEAFADSTQCVGMKLDDTGVVFYPDQEWWPAQTIFASEDKNRLRPSRNGGGVGSDGGI